MVKVMAAASCHIAQFKNMFYIFMPFSVMRKILFQIVFQMLNGVWVLVCPVI